MDVIFLVDQSQSMSGGAGEVATDPKGLRIQAVRYAIENLSLKPSPASPHRIGVVQFGTEAPRELAIPLLEVANAEKWRSFDHQLQQRNLVWTNFAAAIRTGTQLLEEGGAFQTDRRTALILLTDGAPEDARRLPKERYFSEISSILASDVQKRGVRLYVVALDESDRFWPLDGPIWDRLTAGKTYRVRRPDELKEAFNSIVQDVLNLPKLPKSVLRGGRSTFSVGPYLDHVEFHVFGASPGDLKVFDPTGLPLRGQEWGGADYRIIKAFNPKPGNWSFDLVSREKSLTVYRNEVACQPVLILPRLAHAKGRPLRIRVKYAKSDGGLIQELDEYPLRVSANLSALGVVKKQLTLTRRQDMFESDGEIPMPADLSNATLDLFLHAGTAREYQSSFFLPLLEEPYFNVVLRSGGFLRNFGNTIQVHAQLEFLGKPIAPGSVFRTPASVIRAQLAETPSGAQRSPSFWLNPIPGADGRYESILPASVSAEGSYRVDYAVAGVLSKDGKKIGEYVEPVFLNVVPTWLDRALIGGKWVVVTVMILLSLLAAIIVGTLIWSVTLPTMIGGKLTITGPPNPKSGRAPVPVTIPLRGRLQWAGKGFLIHLVRAVRRKGVAGSSAPKAFRIIYLGSFLPTVRPVSAGKSVRIGPWTVEVR